MSAPRFSPDGYHDLLAGFSSEGYGLHPVDEMPLGWQGRQVFLRHDIDAHIDGVEVIDDVERRLGARSTWFVPVSLDFNPGYGPNRRKLRALHDAGHKIGLHYDLRDYPATARQMALRLFGDWRALSGLLGVPVNAAVMHAPASGRPDIIGEVRNLGLVHPHAFPGVTYVSDSCRTWRPEALAALAALPLQFQLNTHHEHWLGDASDDRWAFFRRTMRPNTLRQHEEYVDELWEGWRSHATADAS